MKSTEKPLLCIPAWSAWKPITTELQHVLEVYIKRFTHIICYSTRDVVQLKRPLLSVDRTTARDRYRHIRFVARRVLHNKRQDMQQKQN